MTDGSLRFFDVNINAQVCEFKAVERGESLVTALEACKIVTVDETNKAEESVSLLAVGIAGPHLFGYKARSESDWKAQMPPPAEHHRVLFVLVCVSGAQSAEYPARA